MVWGPRTLSGPGSPAWHDERYEELHAALSDELELEGRSAELHARLEHVNDLVKFCLHEVRLPRC